MKLSIGILLIISTSCFAEGLDETHVELAHAYLISHHYIMLLDDSECSYKLNVIANSDIQLLTENVINEFSPELHKRLSKLFSSRIEFRAKEQFDHTMSNIENMVSNKGLPESTVCNRILLRYESTFKETKQKWDTLLIKDTETSSPEKISRSDFNNVWTSEWTFADDLNLKLTIRDGRFSRLELNFNDGKEIKFRTNNVHFGRGSLMVIHKIQENTYQFTFSEWKTSEKLALNGEMTRYDASKGLISKVPIALKRESQ